MNAPSKACVGASFLAALALMLGSSNAIAQIGENQPTGRGRPVISLKEGMLTHTARNRPLKSVLEEIGDQGGVAVPVACGVGEERASMGFKSSRVDEAFRQIAKNYNGTGGTAMNRAGPTMTTPSTLVQYSNLPLSFEPNRGQTDARVKFLSRGRGYTLFLTRTEAVIMLRKPRPRVCDRGVAWAPVAHREQLEANPPAVLRMQLVGTNPARIAGSQELPGKSNYFIGSDPKQWQANVPTYAQVKYRNVYAGVDLVYYGNPQQLEHDFVLAPGADPKAIRVRFTGVDQLRLNEQGDAIVEASGAQVILRAPVIYQESNGVRTTVAGHYRLRGRHDLGFEVAAYDESKPLIIDPVLVYSTYLGGSGNDVGNGIAVDQEGNAYVIGSTSSTNFPTASPFQDTHGGGPSDVFVSKLSKDGTALVYSSYLGGSGTDVGQGIAVDKEGNAYVTGFTNSDNFPTTRPFQGAFGLGLSDAFVSKLNKDGSALVYSTYLGGSGDDKGNSIAVDEEGNAYVAGSTNSINFPTAGPFQGTISAGLDAFVSKLNKHGAALIYSTYLGGSGDDEALGIAVDKEGDAYVTGLTSSTNFPTAHPFQGTIGAGFDAFVTKLNKQGAALVYSTYLGGSGDDEALGIAVDKEGNAYVTGLTSSTNFPTARPLQVSNGGGLDAFVSKLDEAGAALVYSTYLGGSGDDSGNGIIVDKEGNIYVVGSTSSTNFPTAVPFQGTYGGGFSDAFVSKLNQQGAALVYSTYLGGGGNDVGNGIAVDEKGSAYVTGLTLSTNFPTARPFQASSGGFGDAFVSKISGHRPQPMLEEDNNDDEPTRVGSERRPRREKQRQE